LLLIPEGVIEELGTPLDSSISEDIKALTNSVNQFQVITKVHYLELGNRLSLLEKKIQTPMNYWGH
jgi:hypothetical protein